MIMFDFHIISITLNFCCNRYYRSFVVINNRGDCLIDLKLGISGYNLI